MTVKTMKYLFTDEEWAAAQALYDVEVKKMYAEGYMGDFGSGLAFAIDTYGPVCWKHYFPNRSFS